MAQTKLNKVALKGEVNVGVASLTMKTEAELYFETGRTSYQTARCQIP
jgi:hypothetical protein